MSPDVFILAGFELALAQLLECPGFGLWVEGGEVRSGAMALTGRR